MKVKLAITAVVSLFLTACLPMSEDRATRAVEAAGLSSVAVGRVPFNGCGEDDAFQRKFEAIDSKGRRVTGVVCGGWFKGATVRID